MASTLTLQESEAAEAAAVDDEASMIACAGLVASSRPRCAAGAGAGEAAAANAEVGAETLVGGPSRSMGAPCSGASSTAAATLTLPWLVLLSLDGNALLFALPDPPWMLLPTELRLWWWVWPPTIWQPRVTLLLGMGSPPAMSPEPLFDSLSRRAARACICICPPDDGEGEEVEGDACACACACGGGRC